MVVMTWRRACRSPRLAKVTSFSARGRRRFAFVSVVVIRPCSNSEVARLASISRSCAGDPPRRGPLVGVGMSVLPQAAGRACAGCVVHRGAAWCCVRASVARPVAEPDGGFPAVRPGSPLQGPTASVRAVGQRGPSSELLGLLVRGLVVLGRVAVGGVALVRVGLVPL